MILHVPFLPARGMALFPFILVRDPNDRTDKELLHHERIHLRQQLELLVLPFYIWYLMEYIWYRFKGLRHYSAYMRISFEREAYANEHDLLYLKRRRWGGFLKYL